MDKKEICAFLIGCEVGDFMGYADKGDEGAVIIGPDGKKYRYDAAQLEQAERKAESQSVPSRDKAARSEAQAPKPKPKPPSKAGTSKRTTKRQPASKPTSKPKTGAKS
jgi:hypothetical protein